MSPRCTQIFHVRNRGPQRSPYRSSADMGIRFIALLAATTKTRPDITAVALIWKGNHWTLYATTNRKMTRSDEQKVSEIAGVLKKHCKETNPKIRKAPTRLFDGAFRFMAKHSRIGGKCRDLVQSAQIVLANLETLARSQGRPYPNV
jgi:hypothetical protein